MPHREKMIFTYPAFSIPAFAGRKKTVAITFATIRNKSPLIKDEF